MMGCLGIVRVLSSDRMVRAVTEDLCGDTLAVIATLRPESRREYIDALHKRTRRVLVSALSEGQA